MDWPTIKASRLLAALERIGWIEVRRCGSHRVLARDGHGNYVFAFHDGEEIGRRMLARVSRKTGLRTVDL